MILVVADYTQKMFDTNKLVVLKIYLILMNRRYISQNPTVEQEYWQLIAAFSVLFLNVEYGRILSKYSKQVMFVSTCQM